ncbi:hypothetical protein ENUP19_0326G0003 [Entamoeba nuttalli]
MTEQTQQPVFQLLDDATLQQVDPKVIYQQYEILRREFLSALAFVEPTFDLSSALAGELQRTINENRMYREQYLSRSSEYQIYQQQALKQSQSIRKMEKEFDKKKTDTIEEQKNLQNQLERLIGESIVNRDNVKKTYISLEEEFDNLLRESLSETVEAINNYQHEVDVLKGQKKQIESEEHVEGNIEEIQSLLESSKTKLSNDLEEKNKTLNGLDTKIIEIENSKKENTELVQDKQAFIDKLTHDTAEMDKTLEELRKQVAAKRAEEDNKKEEIIVKSLPQPNHVANLEEKLIIDWFGRFGIEVGDFKTSFNDGLLICQVIDKIKPGVINWSMFARPKNGRSLNIFQRRTNCTVLVETVQTLGLTNTGIGSQDITDGNVKMLMGFFRALMVWETSLKKSLLA